MEELKRKRPRIIVKKTFEAVRHPALDRKITNQPKEKNSSF
jgi:hypothetical protein